MPRSVRTPLPGSSSTTRSPSRTWMRGCASARSASTRRIRAPVAAPPACTTRRRECPPSRPRSESKSTPSSTRLRTRAGASAVTAATALGRQSPLPARSVSSACSSALSSSPIAAATPPWARKLVEASSGPFETTTTSASSAATSAATRPATPPPTITRSACASFRLIVDNLDTSLPTHVTLAAVLQVRDGRLQVLLWQRGKEPFAGAWALPGGYLEPGETLEQSIRRHLAVKVDVRELAHLEQLETLSDPARHPGEWQLATGFLGLIPSDADPELPADTAWHPVDAL